METLTIEFDELGNPVVSVKGVKGKGCKAVTKALEQALGATMKDVTTTEFYAPEVKQTIKRSV